MVQLIWGYSLLITSFVAKPFGRLFFSKIAQTTKEIIALRYTLLGAGISLMAMGCLPIYEEGSLWSTMRLLVARMCAESCAAGEHNIAKIYLLKGVVMQQAKILAAFYEVSTMVGILSAEAIRTCFAWIHNPLLYWRLSFLIAALSTLFNIIVF